jgi:hypothetical protein
MGFMERISNSWKLVKLSWHLLMQDKELLVFPIISTIGAIALFIGIVMPGIIAGRDVSYLTLGLWYLAASFVTIFFNAALFACVKKRLNGGDPTLGYGLREAGKRVVPIFLWSLVSATVGLILRVLEDRAEDNFIAHFVISMLGAAWTLMTMFVVPVIVMEGATPFTAIKRSANLVRKTWGEEIAAGFTMGAIFFGIYILLALIGLFTFFLTPGIFFPVLIGLILAAAIVAVFQATLNMVFDSVLYSYAIGDNVPLDFKNSVSTAIVKKPRK